VEPQANGLTSADMLTQLWAPGERFYTATGTAYADILVDGHRETWPIRSKRFRGWLRLLHGDRKCAERTSDPLRARPARGAGAI
jgi:hypothetical protein